MKVPLRGIVNGRKTIIGFMLVDDDETWILERSWYLSGGYPATGVHVRLHNMLAGRCDHINGNKLDNRRSNLRPSTQAENCQNTPSRVGSVSQYRGVYLNRKTGKWYGQVKHQGIKHNAGTFATEEDAARAVAALRAQILPFSVPGR